jgi:hypothetical protein
MDRADFAENQQAERRGNYGAWGGHIFRLFALVSHKL